MNGPFLPSMPRLFLILTVAGGYQDQRGQVHLRASAKPLPSKQVIFFRHCVRSLDDEVNGVEGFAAAQNFTNQSLPDFETPVKWCTTQGANIMEFTGKWLAATRLPSVSSKTLQMISDIKNRDATSANYLLRGLANANDAYDFNVRYLPLLFNSFDPVGGKGLCRSPNLTLAMQQSAALLMEKSMPMGVGKLKDMNISRYKMALEGLESLVGHGVAGPQEAMPVPHLSLRGTVMMGGASVMRFFGQAMMYAFASGISYTAATVEQRYSYIEWLHFYRKVRSQIPAFLVVKKACGILKVIDDLRSPFKPDIIYSGHDDDLDALAMFFNISWEAPPWKGESPTPPGSALAFTTVMDQMKVQVDFLYPEFNGSAAIPLHSTPTKPSWVDLKVVEDNALKLIQLYAGPTCIDACRGAKII